MGKGCAVKPHKIIHGVAVAALICVTLMSCMNAVDMPNPVRNRWLLENRWVLGIITLEAWGVLALLIWKRPRSWGLGIGTFLLLVLAFQVFLWTRAIAKPVYVPGMIYNSMAFAMYELPLAIAAICCLLLRWVHPRIPDIPKQAGGGQLPR